MTSFSVPMDLPRYRVALTDCKSKLVRARYAAAQALALVDPENHEEAITALLGLLEDPVEDIRAQAVEAICQLRLCGAEVAGDFILSAVRDESAFVRSAALENIELFVDNGDEIAIGMLVDPSPGVRVSALRLLGDLRSDTGIVQMETLLVDDDVFVKQQAAIALGKRGNGQGREILEAMVQERGEESVEAAFVLGLVTSSESAATLRKCAGAWLGSLRLKAMCAAALARHDGESNLEPMQNLLDSSREATRTAALGAVAMLPNGNFSTRLVQIACDRSDSEHASMAIVALAALRQLDDAPGTDALKSLQGRLQPELAKELEEALQREKVVK